MLTHETRFYNWEEFRERVHRLCSDVEDALCFTYAPYGQNEDEDAPYVRKLFHDLDVLDDFMVNHLEVLSDRWNESENQLLKCV